MFKVDARPYEEALRQAEAALARDRAQLRQAEAVLARDIAQSKYAEADSTRYAELSKAGIIARAQADQVRTGADVTLASVRASQAAIESINAAINSDKSAVDKAKLDLNYCAIHAPILGPRRKPAGLRRQPCKGERPAIGRASQDYADLREFQRSRAAPRRNPAAQRQPGAGRPRVAQRRSRALCGRACSRVG